MSSFRQVVEAALVSVEPERVMEPGITPYDAGALAEELRTQLRAAGYSIHRSGECVHPRSRSADLGRPMTPDERVLFGLADVGDALVELEETPNAI